MGSGAPKGFQDVAFLPLRVCFSTSFLKNCGGCECLRITTYRKTVVWGKRGHAPYEILLLKQSIFLCQLNVMETIRLLHS